MEAIYSLENGDGEKRCGFFDPSTTYGGPQVEEPVRIDKNIENLEKSRKNQKTKFKKENLEKNLENKLEKIKK